MQQLSGQDALFLYGEMDNAPMHIGSVLIYDPATAPGGLVRFRDILRTFRERSARSPVFTRRLVPVPFDIDYPFWSDAEDPDIEFHVRHIALPRPGDWRQFCIQIARIHARALDRAHPLWEAYVIEGLDNVEGLPPGSFALFLKIHHAAIDGASGVDIVAALHDLEAQPESGERSGPQPRARRDAGSELDVLRLLGRSLIRQPMGVLEMLGRSVPAWLRVREGLRERRLRSLGPKEHTRFNGRISPHRVFGAIGMSLREVGEIRDSVPGATVNDVMLAVVSGALRRYLTDKGELPPKSLVAGAPVNVREDAELGAGGNRVSMMSIALRTDVDEPLERLRLVHEEAVASKAYIHAVGARLLTDWSNRMPARIAALGFRAASATGLLGSGRPLFNTIVTNVPGAQVPLYMAGARLLRAYGVGPCLDSMGLFQVVTSYAGQIAISFQCCRDMMPDPGFYEQCLSASFEELLAAVRGQPRKAPAHTPRRRVAKRRLP
ncbi:MAG: putative diacylglycerol O-acyltransferase [Pseudomonadales bacterium]|nr:putative diacylglycerol O-acyltransferase [Pseudomonadales bacterium]